MIVFPIALFVLLVVLAVLASPVEQRSSLRFIGAMAMSFVVVVLPLFVFFVSSLMTPDAKDACHHGWLDCFGVGKLALSPLVLLATAALYRVEVLRRPGATPRMALAIYLGALVATVCMVFGLACVSVDVFIVVPLYVAMWYGARAIQLGRQAGVGFWKYFWATLGTIPFWVASWLWSVNYYSSLPDKSDCFVVTAASRGHRGIVGPLLDVVHRGESRRANRQLATLWEFEARWRANAPRSHAAFRRVYNGVGPIIAACIRSPWLADVTYVAIKPVEIIARCLNQTLKKS